MTTINSLELLIETVTPVTYIGQVQLSADRRGKELTSAQRIRRAILPASHWGDYSAALAGTASQSLTDLLRTSLIAIASARLRDALEENPLARTVPLADYTIAALLTWNAESATTRGALTWRRDSACSPRCAVILGLLL